MQVPTPLRSSQQSPDQVHSHAQRRPDAGGQGDGQSGPFPASGLPPDGEAGSAAGEVEEGKEQGAQGGSGGPAVAGQKLLELGEAPIVRQRPGRLKMKKCMSSTITAFESYSVCLADILSQ